MIHGRILPTDNVTRQPKGIPNETQTIKGLPRGAHFLSHRMAVALFSKAGQIAAFTR
jgi:hypothetical protein